MWIERVVCVSKRLDSRLHGQIVTTFRLHTGLVGVLLTVRIEGVGDLDVRTRLGQQAFALRAVTTSCTRCLHM